MKGFGHRLREWRRASGKSQLDLALSANVSGRHISFLETGRSLPSRGMVRRLAQTLELPLRAENILLGAAGFAPRYQERQLEHEDMGLARRALEFILAAHEPYPAFVLNTHWTILYANQAHKRLAKIPNIFEEKEAESKAYYIKRKEQLKLLDDTDDGVPYHG